MPRYSPALVALHWILALMIVVALFVGGPGLSRIDNADPAKIGALQGHMTFGVIVLILMLIRLVVRLRSDKPPHADTGNALVDLAGKVLHWSFYVLVILMCLSGIGISISAGLPAIVFQGSGDPLPPDFFAYPPRIAHGIIANLLMLLVALHVIAALYHQFYLKDGLFRRMWFGKRT